MAGLGKKKAKAKMEKGYQHLLPDCIGTLTAEARPVLTISPDIPQILSLPGTRSPCFP